MTVLEGNIRLIVAVQATVAIFGNLGAWGEDRRSTPLVHPGPFQSLKSQSYTEFSVCPVCCCCSNLRALHQFAWPTLQRLKGRRSLISMPSRPPMRSVIFRLQNCIGNTASAIQFGNKVLRTRHTLGWLRLCIWTTSRYPSVSQTVIPN